MKSALFALRPLALAFGALVLAFGASPSAFGTTALAFGTTALAFGTGAEETPAEETSAEETLPPGVEQILPRGQIPAIVEPHFVSAQEAKIADDAWVLGVVVDGEARAYSLNILNHHEIVNDKIGEKTFAAVW